MENVSLEIGIAMGEVLCAFRTHRHLRRKFRGRIKKSRQDLAQAEHDLNSFGMFEDCGPSYEYACARAQGELWATAEQLAMVVSTEKYFRKLRHAFREKYPEHMPLLEARLREASPL